MYASDLATTLRSAPGWLVATVAILLVILLVAAGPLAGLAIQRRRAAEMSVLLERPGLQRQHGKWIETGEIDLMSLRAEELKRERLAVRAEDEKADSDPVQVIADFSPTTIITIIEEPTKPIERPSWADTPTGAWSAQEYVTEVHDGVVVEDEPHSFYADPLGSWTIPDDEDAGWPTAKSVLEELIDRKWLTGVGADLDIEWEAWNLYATETKGANA